MKKGKFIFVVDPLQLPPIGQKISPALSKFYLESEFSFNVDEFELKEITKNYIVRSNIVAAILTAIPDEENKDKNVNQLIVQKLSRYQNQSSEKGSELGPNQSIENETK